MARYEVMFHYEISSWRGDAGHNEWWNVEAASEQEALEKVRPHAVAELKKFNTSFVSIDETMTKVAPFKTHPGLNNKSMTKVTPYGRDFKWVHVL